MHVSTFLFHAFCHEYLKNSALNSDFAFSAYDPYSAEKKTIASCLWNAQMCSMAPSTMQRKYDMQITSTKTLHFLHCIKNVKHIQVLICSEESRFNLLFKLYKQTSEFDQTIKLCHQTVTLVLYVTQNSKNGNSVIIYMHLHAKGSHMSHDQA